MYDFRLYIYVCVYIYVYPLKLRSLALSYVCRFGIKIVTLLLGFSLVALCISLFIFIFRHTI